MGQVRDFLLPDLGEGLEDGEILEWHVEAGQTVELNQILCVVETAKAAVEIPSPFAGSVVERLGEIGQIVAVGTPLVRIDVEEVAGGIDINEIAPSRIRCHCCPWPKQSRSSSCPKRQTQGHRRRPWRKP